MGVFPLCDGQVEAWLIQGSTKSNWSLRSLHNDPGRAEYRQEDVLCPAYRLQQPPQSVPLPAVGEGAMELLGKVCPGARGAGTAPSGASGQKREWEAVEASLSCPALEKSAVQLHICWIRLVHLWLLCPFSDLQLATE